MSLDTYKQKRNFKRSPEPTGGKPTDKKLHFVVQKHHASHLHYDFRLELRGVLKSWAVPKGLSMNPSESRLAMLVEDHPWDYRDFEGIIPSGYGAGTVIVWDEGTYETTTIKEKEKKAQEHSITSQFWKGQITFTLHGHKLKGGFKITRAKEKGEKSWYIRKIKDEFATKKDITEKDRSVLSHKTLEEIAANPEREWKSHREQKTKKKQEAIPESNDEKKLKTFDSRWKELGKQKITSHDSVEIEGKEVDLTNVENELWKGITKADLITYYNSITEYILPYLVDRPESLYITTKPSLPGVFIKDMEGRQPEWAQVFSTKRKHKKKGKRDVIDYLVCQNRAILLYMINLGCIEINPWTSRITNYQQPDFIIIDLDPSDNDFGKAIKTALAAKKFFDKLKLKAFPKTSGKTGIHLYIPCEGFSFPEARSIAVNISKQVTALVPDVATSENTIAHRGNKIFVDYNQNDEADTVAAPYSVRASNKPTVSTPLDWKEINDKLHPANFDIHNILDRIKKKGDLFKNVLNEKIRKSNSKILRDLL